MKKYSLFIIYAFPFLLVMIAVACNQSKSSFKTYYCKQPHALCSNAECIIMPDNPAKSICYCEVEMGGSVATIPCDKLQSQTDEDGFQTIYSTLSFKNSLKGENKLMLCNEGNWSNCLNQKCTVDPSNPKKAICLCLVEKGKFSTLSGNCDTSKCANRYLSGLQYPSHYSIAQKIKEKEHLSQIPVKWCTKSDAGSNPSL